MTNEKALNQLRKHLMKYMIEGGYHIGNTNKQLKTIKYRVRNIIQYKIR